jgi:hypothetical protein
LRRRAGIFGGLSRVLRQLNGDGESPKYIHARDARSKVVSGQGAGRRRTGLLVSRRLVVLAPCAVLVLALVVISLDGVGALPAGLGRVVEGLLRPAAATLLAAVLAISAIVLRRWAHRCRRVVRRYRLDLAQADETTFEDAAAACEQLIQVIRTPRLRRVVSGQPWLAIEAWFLPPSSEGETGSAVLALVCEPRAREGALAALRHAYPDLRADDQLGLNVGEPDHVLRVRKARSWALPIGSEALRREGSNQRSTMAAIIRQQQHAALRSCVRWCVLPAAERQDSRATQRLERVGGSRPGAALTNDVAVASRSAGGAMAHLELQAAVWSGASTGRGGFMRWQAACRELLAPALSQRGVNHLRERVMVARQLLYRRRWARAEPPFIPDRRLATLVSPRELAALMALPSLGSEHALPFARNTVPYLPVPVEVARARVVDLCMPPAGLAAGPEPAALPLRSPSVDEPESAVLAPAAVSA